jgi:guanosine-3',5'-bis(diphosphate) 3'-pyrophosphohydrolase
VLSRAERYLAVADETSWGLSELELFLKALAFAAHKHRDQKRKDRAASPYINHPIALAKVLAREGKITEVDVLCAALLHDTVEDTATNFRELRRAFGGRIARIVAEVTDDKRLPKAKRKSLQVQRAAGITREAKLVKLADKICNLRDVARRPPVDWDLRRQRAYFDWAKRVIDRLRGVSPRLEGAFDEAYSKRPRMRKSSHGSPARKP